MKTLELFIKKGVQIPTYTVWLLNALAEYKGKQALFARQSPEKLKALKESSVIESSVSSNRIEGIEIDKKRVGTVIFGEGLLVDRNEEEVRGYQEALAWIHDSFSDIDITSDTILKLHAMTRPNIWDSGKLKEKDGEIIETFPDGRVVVRFRPVCAKETPAQLQKLCEYYEKAIKEEHIPPLVILAAFNFDFLAIHPFRDGNGRVSRLLILLLMYKSGFDAGRYVSVEKLIERSKERYYETLKQSSDGWHEGAHDMWKYIDYLLHTLKELYQEFENRYEMTVIDKGSEKGSDKGSDKGSEKSSDKILNQIQESPKITIAQLALALNISTRSVEKHLKTLRESNKIERVGSKKYGCWKVV